MNNPLRDRMRWALIGWMFAISAIAYLDRVNISIAGHFHPTGISSRQYPTGLGL